MEWIKDNNPHYVEQIIQIEEERKERVEMDEDNYQMSNLEMCRYKDSSDSSKSIKKESVSLDDEEGKVETVKEEKEKKNSFNQSKTFLLKD